MIRESPQNQSPGPEGSEPVLDFGKGMRLRVTKHTAPRPHPSDPIHEAAEHFYGCLLQGAWDAAVRGGPNTPGPLDELDPYYLTLKAATYEVVRRLLRGQCITHDRKNREGTAAATAAYFAAWAPISVPAPSPSGRGPAAVPLGLLTLAPAGVLPLKTLVSLPLPVGGPEDWTPAQKSAMDALIDAVGPAHDKWNAEVFDPAQRLAHLPPAQAEPHWTPRLRAVADAWADWWRFQIAPWWEVDATGKQLARGFEGVAATQPRLRRAWQRALREHGFDAEEAAQDLADARFQAGDSVALTDDGRAVLNFRGALEFEADRQNREARRRRKEIPQSNLRPGEREARGPEEAIDAPEYVADAVAAVRAAALAHRRALRQRFRTLGAPPVKAMHHRIARRLAWPLWRGAGIARIARRTGVNRPNLNTAWKAWRQVLAADPEVVRIIAAAERYRGQT